MAEYYYSLILIIEDFFLPSKMKFYSILTEDFVEICSFLAGFFVYLENLHSYTVFPVSTLRDLPLECDKPWSG